MTKEYVYLFGIVADFIDELQEQLRLPTRPYRTTLETYVDDMIDALQNAEELFLRDGD